MCTVARRPPRRPTLGLPAHSIKPRTVTMDSSPPAEANSGLTIQNKYTFWYMRRSRGGGVVESYEDSIKPLGTFQTVRRGGSWPHAPCTPCRVAPPRRQRNQPVPLCVCSCLLCILTCVCDWLPWCSAVQVEGFWSIYNHIVRPNDMTQPTELHLFKHGIKPMWEVCCWVVPSLCCMACPCDAPCALAG